MAQSLKRVGVITLFVVDQERSKEFYERVFEVAAANEDEGSVLFEFDNLFLRLLTRARAETDLLGQVALAEPDSGASSQLAIFVDDAKALCADLAERGARSPMAPSTVPGACATRPFATRTATSGWPAPTSRRPTSPISCPPQGRARTR
jgi:catechol 2,3-dioxygenase-like lactoylglutathione lyase family enzyme